MGFSMHIAMNRRLKRSGWSFQIVRVNADCWREFATKLDRLEKLRANRPINSLPIHKAWYVLFDSTEHASRWKTETFSNKTFIQSRKAWAEISPDFWKCMSVSTIMITEMCFLNFAVQIYELKHPSLWVKSFTFSELGFEGSYLKRAV